MSSIANVTIRPARRDDVRTIVGMLADDHLGKARERLEDPLPESYFRAFDAVAADRNGHAADIACAMLGQRHILGRRRRIGRIDRADRVAAAGNAVAPGEPEPLADRVVGQPQDFPVRQPQPSLRLESGKPRIGSVRIAVDLTAADCS